MVDAGAEGVFLALARAEDAVSRLDARAQACAFADGWAARIDFIEASAWGWTSGEIVDIEDLVLHDAQMDVRLPDQALWTTFGLVRARRRARTAGPELWSGPGAAWLAGRRSDPPLAAGLKDPPESDFAPGAADAPEAPDLVGELALRLRGLSRGETAEPEDAVAEWLAWTDTLPSRAPALLKAATALEAWRLVNPLPRERYVGAVLVAQALRTSGRTRASLLGVEAARRAHPQPPRGFITTAPVRLAYWLRVIAAGAEAGLSELRRLELVRQVVLKRIGGRRTDDRSADLLELLLSRPLVSATMAADHLGVTGQSARRLMAGMGASVIEVSGRSRFRAWRL